MTGMDARAILYRAVQNSIPRIRQLLMEYLERAATFDEAAHHYVNVEEFMSRLILDMRDNIQVSVTQVGGTKVRIDWRSIDLDFLDAHTPTDIKRDIHGRKTTKSGWKRSRFGWWRYFEQGTGLRDFGSQRFGFVPGSWVGGKGDRGGFMAPAGQIIGGSMVTPHPGVLQMDNFRRTWKRYEGHFFTQAKAKIAQEFQRELSLAIRRGLT